MSSYLFSEWGWQKLVCDDPFWFRDQIGAEVDQVVQFYLDISVELFHFSSNKHYLYSKCLKVALMRAISSMPQSPFCCINVCLRIV